MSKRFSEESLRLRSQLEAEARSEAEIERGRRRLLESLDRRKPNRLWLLVPAMAVVLLILFLRPSPPIEGEDLVIVSGAECVQRSERSLSVACNAELWIGRNTEDLTFRRGRARFSVAERHEHHFQIAVSHGVIAVIGTRFMVEQRADGGRIDVEEGTVEFRWTDGSRDLLTKGASLEWPRPPAKVETSSTTPPRSEKKVAPKRGPKRPSSRELMQRLFQLKSQRRFDEAIELLSDGSRRLDFSEAQRERLSYELGVVLRQSGRADEACRHLHAHLLRFPSSPRKKEIADTCP
jgi:hypothetical protein